MVLPLHDDAPFGCEFIFFQIRFDFLKKSFNFNK